MLIKLLWEQSNNELVIVDHATFIEWQFGQQHVHKVFWMGSGSAAPVPKQDDIL